VGLFFMVLGAYSSGLRVGRTGEIANGYDVIMFGFFLFILWDVCQADLAFLFLSLFSFLSPSFKLCAPQQHHHTTTLPAYHLPLSE